VAAFGFDIVARDGAARRGRLRLPHGIVETPAFMPVGTRGAIKAITLDAVRDLDAGIILANTYHLHLRPGDDLIAAMGGLHAFIGWDRPILTDSGGYQVFSLAGRRTLDETGVVFQSHLDGARLALTPESAVDIQARLGADIQMVLDECPAWPATADEAAAAMRRTARWARRARDRFTALAAGSAPEVPRATADQAQFGIVQGGTFPALRDESLAATLAVGFEGYAIGGLSVGEPPDLLYEMVAHTAPQLPAGAPRYLMGVGTPEDLVESVARGVDLFDCVLPTRNARNGQLLTRSGPISIKNARYARDDRPPDPGCGCPTCRRYSRAYLRHLFMSGEMSGAALNTLHNLYFYLDTMRHIRKAIEIGNYALFKSAFLDTYSRRQPV
jgi:queuine tRNA-ribosyltransferase